MGYGTYKATFNKISEFGDSFEAEDVSTLETDDYRLPRNPELRLKVSRALEGLQRGDLIEIDMEFEEYTVFEVRAIELAPRYLLASIRRIEQHWGLSPLTSP